MLFDQTVRKVLAVSAFSLALATSAFGDTFSLDGNFNASNNPTASSAFSYGWIAEGFTPFSALILDCFGGSPTECLNNSLQFPFSASVAWNGTAGTLTSGTPTLFPDYVLLDPQGTAGSVIRFTAPTTDVYSVSGNFIGSDTGQHATAGSIFINGGLQFSAPVTSFNALSPFSLTGISLTAGDTIDFRVSTTSDASFLSTGVGGTITSSQSSTPEPATWILISSVLAIVMLRKSGLVRRA